MLTDIIARYKELFDIIFIFVLPFVKLFAIGIGVWLLVDLQWIVHQIRKNAEGYQNGEGAD